MTVLSRLFPALPDTNAEEILDAQRKPVPDGPLVIGDPRVREFLATVSARLLAPSTARKHPELAALGFFLRPTEIESLIQRHATHQGVHRFPRGLVFHIPPANVDTIFVYSWALSALAGNPNIVRISPRADDAALTVLRILNDCLRDAHPAVAHTQHMVSYKRDDDITTLFSGACRLRVIWGGDASINAIRLSSLSPAARDVTFADRSSLCVIKQETWDATTPVRRNEVVRAFHDDAYWFDQAACASPRSIVWVGPDPRQAHDDFMSRLREVAVPSTDGSMAVQKRVSTYRMAATGVAGELSFTADDGPVSMTLTEGASLPREWLGTGVFGFTKLDQLSQLHTLIAPRDQTLTYFGFEPREIDEFAAGLDGNGIDRIVPIGEALSFASIWDGFDLFDEFTRLTTVRHG